MGTMRVFCMAVMATLAPLLAVAPEPPKSDSSDANEEVDCQPAEEPHKVTVSKPGTTVVVKCQQEYTFDPVVNSNPQEQRVYKDEQCKDPQPLTTVCPNVSIAIAALNGKTPGATLIIKTLPADKAQTFFVQCIPAESGMHRAVDGEACKVQVTVNKASDDGPQNQTGGAGQSGKGNVCSQPGASITVSVPVKDSSVQFQCEKEFYLYPADPKRVFKEDCKTEENLKDMTRTHAPAATTTTGTRSQELEGAAQSVYTLRADKKLPKRRLCYLCAKQGASDKIPGPRENYCAIYVESSARAQFDAVLTPALMLWCALAVLHLT